MSDAASGLAQASAAYEAAHERAMIVVREDRIQLRAHGRDPVRMIQGLVTNDMDLARSDRAVYAAMLTPKGRMIADMRILRSDDGSVLLDLDRAALEPLLAHLKKFVPPMFARFDEVQPPLAVLGVHGPAAASIVRATTDLEIPDDANEYDVARAGDITAIGTRDGGVPGIDLFVPAHRAAALGAAMEQAGAVRGGAATLELLRIEAGRPRWGAELDEERIPLEAGLRERAISTSKGCYTGQEVIIRILHRGHVNWQLGGLLLGDAEPPARGTELTLPDGDKAVARVTSAVRSPALGQTIALAYLRREITPGAELRLPDGGPATAAALPFELAEQP